MLRRKYPIRSEFAPFERFAPPMNRALVALLEKRYASHVEVAEFDSLHDDGVLYTSLLRDVGVLLELLEVKRAMHGFDTMIDAPHDASDDCNASRIHWPSVRSGVSVKIGGNRSSA